MSLKQKAVKGVLWASAQNWGRQALFFITFVILARLLGPEDVGLVSLSTIVIHFVHALLGSSFSDAIIQRKKLDPEHLDTSFWCNLGIGVFLFILSLATANVIAASFNQPELASLIRWMSFIVVLSALNTTQQAILRRQLAFKSLAIRGLLGQMCGSITAIIMALNGLGVWSLVAQQLVTNLASTILLWKISNWRPGLKISKKHFQDLFNFGINIVGINILTFVNVRSDDLLIGYFLGPTVLGYYTVAYKLLVTLTQLMTDTVRQVILPTFSRLQENQEKMREAFYTATELVGFAAIPAFAGMALLAPEIVLSLFGEQWEPSIPVMQLLAFVGVMRTLFNFTGAIMMSVGKPTWALGIMVAETVTQIIAFLIAAQWGIVAVAAALVVASYLFAPIKLWIIYRLIHLDIKVYFSHFIPPVLASSVMALGIFLCKHLFMDSMTPQYFLAGIIPISIILYGLVIFLTAPQFFRRLIDIAQQASAKKIPKKT